MSIDVARRQEIINEHKRSDNDTGSVEVQVALLTARIRHLTEHLKAHHKDNHSRNGLMKMVSKRRKLLKYIKNNAFERYEALLKSLGLRR